MSETNSNDPRKLLAPEEALLSTDASKIFDCLSAWKDYDWVSLISSRFKDFKEDVIEFCKDLLEAESLTTLVKYNAIAVRPHCDCNASTYKQYKETYCKDYPAMPYLYRALWDESWPNSELDSADTMNSNNRIGFAKRKADPRLAELYEYLTGTVGNFIPLPAPIQTFHNRFCYEYWDVLMYVVAGRLNKSLSQKFKNRFKKIKDNELKALSEWTCLSGNDIKRFIKNGYLSAYFQNDYALPFEGHDIQDEAAENGIIASEEVYFMSVCSRIIARGNELIEALESKVAEWEAEGWPNWIDEKYQSRKEFIGLFLVNTNRLPAH